MCRVKKKEEPIVTTTYATNQPHKGQKNNSSTYHIYGLNGHKMINSPKFVEMQKMFQGENASSLERKMIIKVKTITIDVNVIDINVATKRKITKDQVFHEKEPWKNKSTTDWEEEKFKKTIIETIQQFQKALTTNEGSSTSIEGWNTMWSCMLDPTPFIEPPKSQKFVVSQSKSILVEEIFQDISIQMLETSYTLNLRQLLKMALELKRYLWKKMKLDQPFVILEVAIVIITTNNHIVIIQIQIGKNTIEDVLLECGLGYYHCTKQFKLKLGSPKPKPAPYNLRMVEQTTTKPMN